MAFAAVGISHAPLMGSNDPDAATMAAVEGAFNEARRFVTSFDPELVLIFAPDHYNGLFYDLMPSICIGMAATSVGDWRSSAGPLSVDRPVAQRLAQAALDAEIDVAVSERLEVDHGFAQPLDVIFGGLDTAPLVPIFINCAAPPLGPVRRARRLGQVLGRTLAGMDRRILLIGSGGLSHDPPLPRLEGASPDLAARLIDGRHPSAEARQARETMVTRVGAEFAAGTATIQPLNPHWDNDFLTLLASGDLDEVETWENDKLTAIAGSAVHEVRTWVAAYSALSEAGPYTMTSQFYQPIPEWIAGFAVTTAITS